MSKSRDPEPVVVVELAIFCQIYQAEGVLYASRAGKGRSPGGTRKGYSRLPHRLGRCPGFIEVARRGSVRSAAERLEFSLDGVRGRIDNFQIGAALLRAWQENDTFLASSTIRYLAFLIPASPASHVRHMIDGLVEAFNPAKFPWFKEEFRPST